MSNEQKWKAVSKTHPTIQKLYIMSWFLLETGFSGLMYRFPFERSIVKSQDYLRVVITFSLFPFCKWIFFWLLIKKVCILQLSKQKSYHHVLDIFLHLTFCACFYHTICICIYKSFKGIENIFGRHTELLFLLRWIYFCSWPTWQVYVINGT